MKNFWSHSQEDCIIVDGWRDCLEELLLANIGCILNGWELVF